VLCYGSKRSLQDNGVVMDVWGRGLPDWITIMLRLTLYGGKMDAMA